MHKNLVNKIKNVYSVISVTYEFIFLVVTYQKENDQGFLQNMSIYFKNTTNFQNLLKNDGSKQFYLKNSFIKSIANNDKTQYCKLEDVASKFKTNNNFTILHINIRSIHANIEGLQELLVQCNISPDVIAVSETKLKVPKFVECL